MKTESHILLVLSALTILSCSKELSTKRETPIDVKTSITKADMPAFPEDAFDFSVRERDIWAFVARQKDFPQILSLEPQERDGDTLLFVAQLEKGWRIFSADKHLPPVVAEIPEGQYNQSLLENSAFRMWMSAMMNLTSEMNQEKSLSSATDYTDLWEGHSVAKQEMGQNQGVKGLSMEPTWTRTIINQQTTYQMTDTHGPLLETKWGQGSPWNNKLPMSLLLVQYPTGCVAVAVSQLLYYYHNAINCPSGLYQDISITNWALHPATSSSPAYYTSNLSRTNYQNPSTLWGQMVKDYLAYIMNYPSSVAGVSYVSDLMVDVGNRMNMQYYADGSGSVASIGDAQSAMVSFGLSSTLAYFNEPYAYSNILNDMPLFVLGVDTSGDDDIVHAWVIDGAKKYQFVSYNTYQWWMGYNIGSLPNGEEMTLEEAQEAAWEIGLDKPEEGMITYGTTYSNDAYYQFHMNWGWDGLSDGYYYMTDTVYVNNQSYQFIVNLGMLYNIHASSN